MSFVRKLSWSRPTIFLIAMKEKLIQFFVVCVIFRLMCFLEEKTLTSNIKTFYTFCQTNNLLLLALLSLNQFSVYPFCKEHVQLR